MKIANRTLRSCSLLPFKASLALFCAYYSLCYSAFTFSNTLNPELMQQRHLFSQANKALKQQKIKHYKQLRSQLNDYPLAPYLDYNYLNNNLSAANTRQVQRYIKQRQVPHLARQLDRNWIKFLAKKNAYKSLSRYQSPWFKYPFYQCKKLNAKWRLGQKKAVFEAVDDLWLSGKNLPSNCSEVVKQWRKAGQLTPALTWIRFNKAIKQRNISLARHLKTYLPKAQQSMADDVLGLLKNPLKTLAANTHSQHIANAQISARKQGLKYLAKQNPEQAEQLFLKLQQQKIISQHEAYSAIVAITYGYKKLNREPDAIQWLSRVINPHTDERLLELRLRLALKQKRWSEVLAWIEALPPSLAKQPQWLYWQIRARQTLRLPEGNEEKTRQAYQKLARQRNYYGFLAAEYLQQTPNLNQQVKSVPGYILNNLLKRPGWQRMIELKAHGMDSDIRSEWYVFSSHLRGEQQWLAAAKLAAAQQFHNIAINAAAHIKHWDDIPLRFPTPHTKSFNQYANSNKLTPNWVYAIARQESSFTPSATSHAGAVGLLQLLPATAKETAKEFNLPYQSKWLTQAEYNIQLGTHYLAKLQAEFDHNQVFTTAAYNAGPHRVKSWLKHTPDNISMDIWIEAIPFRETRHYVKNVIAYSIIYARQLNIEYSVSQFMGQMAVDPVTLPGA